MEKEELEKSAREAGLGSASSPLNKMDEEIQCGTQQTMESQ
jgi:hypothetical protein